MIGLGLLSAFALGATGTLAQSPNDLGRFFGFEEPRIIVVDYGMGPALADDLDGDGLNDLVCVNNAKSRIEIHAQRSTPRTQNEMERGLKPNELPPNANYDRVDVSVAHRVTAFRVHDVDGDGRKDIIYAGRPSEIVILRQTDRLTFELLSKRRVPALAAGQDGLEIADLLGDERPELAAIVGGKINIYGLSENAVTGEPLSLGSTAEIVAFFVEDYNGDGMSDLMAALPSDPAPVRVWLQDGAGSRRGNKDSLMGPELRFEMPPIRELEAVRFPDRDAASIAHIELASRRVVLSDLAIESIGADSLGGVERESHAEIRAFSGGTDSDRSVVVADVDADGMLDLLSTEKSINSVAFFPQQRVGGMTVERTFSALKDPLAIAAGQWDDDDPLEVFVLSEEDKTVGVSQYDTDAERLRFPQPLPLKTAGASPVAMSFASMHDGPALAVIMRDRRDHVLELHRPGGAEPVAIELEGVNRPPRSMLAGDFDRDGATDLVLFTPNEPLVMVSNVASDDAQVLTDDGMPQFGLVQAAGPLNTALLDADGDGADELLIADENFVRACAFDAERGWRVVDQITMPESSASLVALSVLEDDSDGATIVAFDSGNSRLVLMGRSESGAWDVTDRLRLSAVDVNALHAGAFSGDGEPNVLCVSDSAFAIVRLAGERVGLDEFAAYRSDDDDLLEHEIEVGDLNSDGYVDLVVLDALEQQCQIFTISAARRLFKATEFKVFESRLFNAGEEREYEPSAAILSDMTGDGATDLVLQVHDRYMIYPQTTGR